MGAFDCELAALGYRSSNLSSKSADKPKTFYLTWDGSWGRGSRGAHYKSQRGAVNRYWKEYHLGNKPALWFQVKGFERGRHLSTGKGLAS